MQKKLASGAYYLFGSSWNRVGLGLAKNLRISQWWDRANLERWQARRLSDLLNHAQRSVPWYVEHLSSDSGLLEDARQTLGRLPVLTKAQVRLHLSEMVTRDPQQSRAIYTQTGGSTGEPLKVCTDKWALGEVAAATLRGKEWAGLSIGDATVSLKAHGRISFLGKTRQALLNSRAFSSCLDREQLINQVIPGLKKNPPKCLTGYPTSLLALANMLEKGDLTIPVILTTGEMLYQHQREKLVHTFGAKVFEYYGSNEVPGIAFECEHRQLHVTEEQLVVEVVDDRGDPVWDKVGRVLVTDLRNRAMPFIRYELGDLAILSKEPCPCGRSLAVLKKLEGRSQDAIEGSNGVRLSGVFFAGRFRNFKSIRAYQVLQKNETEIELRFVSAGTAAAAEIEEMVSVIRGHMGEAMSIDVRRFENLPLTRAGKTRLVVGLGSSSGSCQNDNSSEIKTGQGHEEIGR